MLHEKALEWEHCAEFKRAAQFLQIGGDGEDNRSVRKRQARDAGYQVVAVGSAHGKTDMHSAAKWISAFLGLVMFGCVFLHEQVLHEQGQCLFNLHELLRSASSAPCQESRSSKDGPGKAHDHQHGHDAEASGSEMNLKSKS